MNITSISNDFNILLRNETFHKQLLGIIHKEVKRLPFPTFLKNQFTTEEYLSEAYVLFINHLKSNSKRFLDYYDNNAEYLNGKIIKSWFKESIKFILSSNGNLFRKTKQVDFDNNMISFQIGEDIYNKQQTKNTYDMELLEDEFRKTKQEFDDMLFSGVFILYDSATIKQIDTRFSKYFLSFLLDAKLTKKQEISLRAVFVPHLYFAMKYISPTDIIKRDTNLSDAGVSYRTFLTALSIYNETVKSHITKSILN